jgi:hypothetical protein
MTTWPTARGAQACNSINLLFVALIGAPTAHFIFNTPETITEQPSSPASTTLSLKGKTPWSPAP